MRSPMRSPSSLPEIELCLPFSTMQVATSLITLEFSIKERDLIESNTPKVVPLCQVCSQEHNVPPKNTSRQSRPVTVKPTNRAKGSAENMTVTLYEERQRKSRPIYSSYATLASSKVPTD